MIRTTVFAVALLASFAATGQQLPRQAEFYFDADAAALRPVLELKDRSPAGIERLRRSLARTPGAPLETAQLAHYAMTSGQESGRALYQQALSAIDTNSALWRPVRFNYGWDLYRSGDAAGALAQWAAIAADGDKASWLPPTLAVALWKLDRRDEAMRWYAAAVRTEPTQWSTTASYKTLLPQWRDDERGTLAEVQAAWAKNPPRWP